MTELALQADCARCVGLCCVAPGFAKSADFAIDKPPATPCPNLGHDFGCRVHDRLRPLGFPGCTTYDCFGAGQHLTQGGYAGRSWREDPATASEMFAAFAVLRDLHELLWHLAEAGRLAPDVALEGELNALTQQIVELTEQPPPELIGTDLGPIRATVNPLLQRAVEWVRPTNRDHRGADFVGRDLHGRDLHSASLRGALLIGVDLRGADLRLADLTGADLRGADVRGADLSTSLFLTQSQLDSARGDGATRLGRVHRRPSHWVD